jgi:4-hydroxy-4-methyl-2-oxoglutarate aldolase
VVVDYLFYSGRFNRSSFFTNNNKWRVSTKGENISENTMVEKKKLIERLADSPSALICMAYDFMGLHVPCADWTVLDMTPGLPPMVGEAITITLDCSTPDDERKGAEGGSKDLYTEMLVRMEKTDIPQVVVIQSLGEKSSAAVAGDGMAKTFLAVGARGLITDGAIRDLDDVIKAGLKTFGGGRVPNHYSLHWSGLGDPVTVGGLTISTGDILHGDGDGVIVLPKEGWGKVVRACRYILDFEKSAHVNLRRTDIGILEKNRIVKEVLAPEYREKIRNIAEFEGI